MSRGLLTHITTECGHQYRTRWPAARLRGATTDCRTCGTLLIFPDNIAGTAVRALDFHKFMHAQDPRWPADGHGTGYVEF